MPSVSEAPGPPGGGGQVSAEMIVEHEAVDADDRSEPPPTCGIGGIAAVAEGAGDAGAGPEARALSRQGLATSLEGDPDVTENISSTGAGVKHFDTINACYAEAGSETARRPADGTGNPSPLEGGPDSTAGEVARGDPGTAEGRARPVALSPLDGDPGGVEENIAPTDGEINPDYTTEARSDGGTGANYVEFARRPPSQKLGIIIEGWLRRPPTIDGSRSIGPFGRLWLALVDAKAGPGGGRGAGQRFPRAG